MLNEWQERRSEFNHDWLKNQFLNRLNAFLERLQDAKPDAERLARFVSEDLPDWERHEAEAQWLVDFVESEMSPMRFFEQPPLNRCDEETKHWLPDAVHEIWLARFPVRQLQSQTRALLSQTNKRYQKVQTALRDHQPTDAATLNQLREHFMELSRACAELHDGFSALDREVRSL